MGPDHQAVVPDSMCTDIECKFLDTCCSLMFVLLTTHVLYVYSGTWPYGHPVNTDTWLIQTCCSVPAETHTNVYKIYPFNMNTG